MRIAVTGHRPNRLHIGQTQIAARLSQALAGLGASARARNRAAPLIALSALAEGADRLFAKAALDLGMSLHAYLPFTVEDYLTTFGDARSTPSFHALLQRASEVTVLPGRLADSGAAYEAVGRAMVEACDAVIAVWDRKPSAGRGGTPEIIAYALERGRQVILIDAAIDQPAQRLTAMAPQIVTARLA